MITLAVIYTCVSEIMKEHQSVDRNERDVNCSYDVKMCVVAPSAPNGAVNCAKAHIFTANTIWPTLKVKWLSGANWDGHYSRNKAFRKI